jgi:hypothetical protein
LLREYGLVVNKTKTEICIFHKHECQVLESRVKNIIVETKNDINVLGILFSNSAMLPLWMI